MGNLSLYDAYTPLSQKAAQDLALLLNKDEEDGWTYQAEQVAEGAQLYRVKVNDADGHRLGYL